MKKLQNSIVIENVKVGLNSLKVKDTKFNDEGSYYLIALLEKGKPELQSVMEYINEVLKKEGSNVKKEMKRIKSPIEEAKCDGDIVFASFEGALNERLQLKGEYLKNMYGIKIRTCKDFKVLDVNKKEIDKASVNWSGATVNVHCSPYMYSNKFGKGLTIPLLNIQVLEQGMGGFDSLESAFGDCEVKNDDELPF